MYIWHAYVTPLKKQKKSQSDLMMIRGVQYPTATTQPFPSPPSSPLPSFLFPSTPLPLLRGPGSDPRKIFGISDAHRRVLEHFVHKNLNLYERSFFTVSCNFRISSKCACVLDWIGLDWIELSKVYRPTRHILSHLWEGGVTATSALQD